MPGASENVTIPARLISTGSFSSDFVGFTGILQERQEGTDHDYSARQSLFY